MSTSGDVLGERETPRIAPSILYRSLFYSYHELCLLNTPIHTTERERERDSSLEKWCTAVPRKRGNEPIYTNQRLHITHRIAACKQANRDPTQNSISQLLNEWKRENDDQIIDDWFYAIWRENVDPTPCTDIDPTPCTTTLLRCIALRTQVLHITNLSLCLSHTHTQPAISHANSCRTMPEDSCLFYKF